MMRSIDLISEKLGDSLNPVFVKEFRQFLRSRVRKFGWLGLPAMQVAGLLLSLNCERESGRTTLAVIYLILLVGLAWGMLSDMLSRWTAETSSDGIAPELTTNLAPGVIINGKLQAMLAAAGLTLLFGLPFAWYAIELRTGPGWRYFSANGLLFLSLYGLAALVAPLLMIWLSTGNRRWRINPALPVIIAMMVGWVVMTNKSVEDPAAMAHFDFGRAGWLVGLSTVIFCSALYFLAIGKLLPVTADRLRRGHLVLAAGAAAAFLPGGLERNYNLTFGLLVWLAMLTVISGLGEVFPQVRGRVFSGGAVRAMGLAWVMLFAAGNLLNPRHVDGRFSLCFALLVLGYAEVTVLLRQRGCKLDAIPLFLMTAAAANLPALVFFFHRNPLYCLFSPAIGDRAIAGAWSIYWCGGLSLLLLAPITVGWYLGKVCPASDRARPRRECGNCEERRTGTLILNTFSTKLGDNLNPVLVKELRQFCRNRMLRYGVIGMLGLEAAGFYLGWRCRIPFDLERLAALSMIAAMAATWGVIAMTMNRWSRERSLDGLSPEFCTTLSPAKILNGKLAAALLTGAAVLAAWLPLTVFLLARYPEGREFMVRESRLLFPTIYFLLMPPTVLLMMTLILRDRDGRHAKNMIWLVLLVAICCWIGIVEHFFVRYMYLSKVSTETFKFILIYGAVAMILGGFLYCSALGRLLPVRRDRLRWSHLAALIGALAAIGGAIWGKYEQVGQMVVLLLACGCAVDCVDEVPPGGGGAGEMGAVRASALAYLMLTLGAYLLVKPSEPADYTSFAIGFLILLYAECAVFLRQWGIGVGGIELFILTGAAGNLLALPAAFGSGSVWLAFSFGLAGRENGLNALWWSGAWALLLLILIACRRRFAIAPRKSA